MSSNGFRHTVKKVTPSIAAELLKANTNNRRLRPYIIEQYAADMRDGEWSLTGDAIKVASDGTILDGQHRLQACILSGTAFRTVLVTGVGGEAFTKIDTGLRRSAGDALRHEGHKNVVALANAVRTAVLWSRPEGPNIKKSITNRVAVEYVAANPELIGLVAQVDREGIDTGLRSTIGVGSIAAAWHLMRKADAEKADAFWGEYFHGTEVDLPPVRLRARMIRNLSVAQSAGRLHPYVKLALIGVAWHHYLSGKRVKGLRWTERSPFPVIWAEK